MALVRRRTNLPTYRLDLHTYYRGKIICYLSDWPTPSEGDASTQLLRTPLRGWPALLPQPILIAACWEGPGGPTIWRLPSVFPGIPPFSRGCNNETDHCVQAILIGNVNGKFHVSLQKRWWPWAVELYGTWSIFRNSGWGTQRQDDDSRS